MILCETLIQGVNMIFKRSMGNPVKEGNIIITMEMIICHIQEKVNFGIWMLREHYQIWPLFVYLLL